MAASEDEEEGAIVEEECSRSLVLRAGEGRISASLGRRYWPRSAWVAPGDEATRSCECPAPSASSDSGDGPVGSIVGAQGLPSQRASIGAFASCWRDGEAVGSSRKLHKGEKHEVTIPPSAGSGIPPQEVCDPGGWHLGSSCRADAGTVEVACSAEVAQPKDETEDRHDSRKTITGTICLQVHYEDGIGAHEDVRALHVVGRRVFVKESRSSGPAFRSGVRPGDELVLVRVGRNRPRPPSADPNCIKQLAESSITGMAISFRGPPIVLYFMGFAGRFPAEVRVTVHTAEKCGLLRVGEVVGGAPFHLKDQVVLRPREAPLLLMSSAAAAARPDDASGSAGEADGGAVRILELEQASARWLLRRACIELPSLGHPDVGGGWLWSRRAHRPESQDAWAFLDLVIGQGRGGRPMTTGAFSLCGGLEAAPLRPPPAVQREVAPRGAAAAARTAALGPQVAARHHGGRPVAQASAWRSLPQLPVHTLSLARAAEDAESQTPPHIGMARAPGVDPGRRRGGSPEQRGIEAALRTEGVVDPVALSATGAGALQEPPQSDLVPRPPGMSAVF